MIDTERGTATPYGTGAAQVWVLRPKSGEMRSVVVYLHGYGAYLPFEWHLQWMDHLLEKGSTVIFPRYQTGGDDPFILTPFDLAAGLQTGFDAIEYDGEPVVAAGFSLARLWLSSTRPAPRSGVFRRRARCTRSSRSIRSSSTWGSTSRRSRTRRHFYSSADHDDVVGQDGARELMNGLVGLPGSLKELRLIRTTDHLFATHEAPTVVHDPVVRRTFWVPLDRLVAGARREEDG